MGVEIDWYIPDYAIYHRMFGIVTPRDIEKIAAPDPRFEHVIGRKTLYFIMDMRAVTKLDLTITTIKAALQGFTPAEGVTIIVTGSTTVLVGLARFFSQTVGKRLGMNFKMVYDIPQANDLLVNLQPDLASLIPSEHDYAI